MDVEIRQNWRMLVRTPDEWEPTAAMRANPGIEGGEWLQCKQTGHIAWRKPLRSNPDFPVAAREKIASDFGFDVGVNVPPVLLMERSDAPQAVCLSLLCFPVVRHWSEVFGFDESDDDLSTFRHRQTEQALAAASGVIALHSWLDNRDTMNPENVLLGASTNRQATFLFIDFGSSMDWDGRDPDQFEPVAIPEPFRACLNRNAVVDIARRIHELPDEAILATVNRIPPAFISERARKLHIDGLLHRKRQIVHRIEDWYPG